MKIVMLKSVPHDKLGVLVKGQTYDVAEPRFACLGRWVQMWLQNGTCEMYDTKVIRENPLPIAGAAVPLSFSPAVPLSTDKTLKPSKGGGRKPAKSRGR